MTNYFISISNVDVSNAEGTANVETLSNTPPGNLIEYGLASRGEYPTSWQYGTEFTNLSGGDYTAWTRVQGFETTLTDYYDFSIVQYDDLQAYSSSTNCTVNGGQDGSITATITAGSGSYQVTFLVDGTVVNVTATGQSATKSNLFAGIYSIKVEDLITGQILILQATVNEPAPSTSTSGTKLEVPFLNSLSFVVANSIDCDNPQAIDNVLFCQQIFKAHTQPQYYQKLANATGLLSI